jgi:hypothetical protein
VSLYQRGLRECITLWLIWPRYVVREANLLRHIQECLSVCSSCCLCLSVKCNL